MPELTIDGAKIAFTETGTGEPAILLHSSASSKAQWRSLTKALSSRFRVLAPDLYGYGDSDAWPGRRSLTFADEAKIVAALIDHAGEPVHLVGHSYGGAVALRAVQDFGNRIRSLTLIEPVAFHLLRHGHAEDQGHLDEVRAIARTVGEAVLRGDNHGGMAQFVDYWNGPGAWTKIKPDVQTDLARRLGKVALDFRAGTSETSDVRACGWFVAPVLVLCGTRSPEPTRAISRIVAVAFPRGRHRTVAGAGHMLPLTHPDEVNAHIVEHLQRCEGVEPSPMQHFAA